MSSIGKLVVLSDSGTLDASHGEIALYGHTHRMDCHQEEDGLWVFNPGSAGYNGGSAGILKTDGEKITACYFVTQEDLEEIK